MQRKRVRFNVALMEMDLTEKGWLLTDLAKKSGRSNSTIGRFFSGERRTARVAKDIAAALGHDVDRYLIGTKKAVAA